MTIDIDDKQNDGQATSELDLYAKIVSTNVDDDFLSSNNFGLGNYEDDEMWQQVRSFADGMWGEAAFGRLISERMIREAKQKLATEGWSYTGESGREIEFNPWHDRSKWDEHERREAIRERGEEIWNKLHDEEKFEAVREKVGLTDGWTPPQWRMMQVRHEASRSRGARTQDNVFGRVKKHTVDDNSDALEGEI